ncbi:MAG: SpoIIE family protein phosphatase [Planctomycetota bacterium]|nr:MAG: SpoIIE family protein phosphatase [Planctomycetota bacterium]
MNTNNDPSLNTQQILDSLNDGVYVVDRDRAIIYWGKAAEKITGWQANDIIGKRCYDDILCHTDKDGHRLCGEEYCPLHRAMITNQSSTTPIIVFAQSNDGRQIPMEVSVAPVRNNSGEVIGGVETFRDLSSQFHDVQRAQKIQLLSLPQELPGDERIRFSTHYIPHDVIGGDYYAVAKINSDSYGFILADVTGHGVPAALYTMYLNSLWEENYHLISSPTVFAETVNEKLRHLIGEDTPFAAGICGIFDLKNNKLRLSSAGNPPPFLIHSDGKYTQPDCRGLPLGCMEGATYDEITMDIDSGDCLLFFTDGAIEIKNANDKYLQMDGLMAILKRVGYPKSGQGFKAIEEQMLKYSDRIRFDDDLTFLEVSIY